MPKNKTSLSRTRIRAFRRDETERQLELCRIRLGMGTEFTGSGASEPQRLARALRMARRAAISGTPDYDPVRHLLLSRYFRSLKLARSGKSQDQEGFARKDVYDRNLEGGLPEP